MRVETAMSRAAPWPLKIVIDNAPGRHPLPEWLERVHALGIDRDTMGLARFAGIAVVIVALDGDRSDRRGPARRSREAERRRGRVLPRTRRGVEEGRQEGDE